MRYALLICDDENNQLAASPEEGAAVMAEYAKWTEDAGARGVLQGGERHALHLRHHAPREIGVAILERRQREAAVPADHARYAVPARRCRQRIPVQLGGRGNGDEERREGEPGGEAADPELGHDGSS